jgi:hypothetical protein
MSAGRRHASLFRKRLDEYTSGSRKRRRWIFVAYDQLNDAIGPLAKSDPRDTGIVLVENR